MPSQRARAFIVGCLATVTLLWGVGPARAPTADASDLLVAHQIFGFQRGQSAAVYDSRRGHLVVFGGYDGSGALTSEVNILDLSDPENWRRADAAGQGPQATGFDTAVYDSMQDRMLVFTVTGPGVWSLSLSGPMTWTRLSTSGSRPRISSTSVIYDKSRDRVVGFGGYDSGGNTINDAWTLSLGATPTWAPLAAAGGTPPTRASGGCVYDPLGDRILVFGGETVSGGVHTLRNDVWQLGFVGGVPTWNAVQTIGAPPAARVGCVAVLDPGAGQLLVFGGLAAPDDDAVNDTWTLSVGDATPTWRQVPTPVNPAARMGAAAFYDPTGRRVILAGGQTGGGVAGALMDTWQLALGGSVGPWSQILVRGSGTQDFYAFDYDPRLKRFLGVVPAPVAFDVWFLSMADTTYTPTLSAGEPTPHFPYALQHYYDWRRNKVYAFNPDTLYSMQPGPGEAWTATPIPGPRPPSVNQIATSYYDPDGQRILMIGGRGAGFFPTQSTEFWILSTMEPVTWTKISDTTPLGIRLTPAIHDVRRNRLLFFGGIGVKDMVTYGDLWQLDLGSLQWQALNASGVTPPPRFHFAAAYDSTRDRVVIFGGGSDAPSAGVCYLQFGPSDSQGRWSGSDPVGAPMPGEIDGMGAWDVGLDAMVVSQHAFSSPPVLYMLTWGAMVAPVSVVCPPPAPFSSGTIVPLEFQISQGQGGPHTYAWRVDSARRWPGFPLLGFQDVSAAGTVPVAIGIPVPDTAAAGIDILQFAVYDQADVSVRDSCASAVFGGPQQASTVSCPPPAVGAPGSSVPLTFRITQTSGASHTYAWRVESTRAWPGLPLAGTRTLNAAGVADVTAAIAIPDSADFGVNGLRFAIADQADLPQRDSCATPLSVAATASPTLTCPPAATWAPGSSVNMTFGITQVAANAHTYAWSMSSERAWPAYPQTGTVSVNAPGTVEVGVEVPAPDSAAAGDNALGLSIYDLNDPTRRDTCATSIRSPGTSSPVLPLAFAAGGALVVHGALDVAFTLPAAGPARVDAYDLRGRRVATGAVDAAGAGDYSLRLAGPRMLHSGVYFLRLTQGVARAQGRALLLVGP